MLKWVYKGKVAVLSTLAAVALAACGGSGVDGAALPPASSGNTVSGVVKSTTKILTKQETKALAAVTPLANGGLQIQSQGNATLKQAKAGDIIALPPNDENGLFMGYTGKVVKTTDASGKVTTTLAPANVEDVFSKLKVDIDTQRDGAKVAGVYTTLPGMRASFVQMSGQREAAHQAGVADTIAYSSCYLESGLKLKGELRCKDYAIDGTLSLEHDFDVPLKNSNKKVKATFYATISLRNGKIEYLFDYDTKKYKEAGGWLKMRSVAKIDYAASVGVKIPGGSGKFVLSDKLNPDGKNIWNERKWKLGKYFELMGLKGDDKEGLLPLGGIVVTPSMAIRPFSGSLDKIELLDKGAVILWVYLRADGKIELKGQMDFLRLDNMRFHRGIEMNAIGGYLVTKVINDETPPTIKAPYIKGEADLKASVSAVLASDFMVAGIRPFTIQADIIKYEQSLKIQGDGGLTVLPLSQFGPSGSFCYKTKSDLSSRLWAAVRIKAKMGMGWFKAEGTAAYENEPWKKIWRRSKDNTEKCHVSAEPKITAKIIGANPVNSAYRIVELDFTESFNNSYLSNLTNLWSIKYDDAVNPQKQVLVSNDSRGKHRLSLPAGKTYTFTLGALTKDKTLIKSSTEENSAKLTLPLAPDVDFSVKAKSTGDCKNLLVRPIINNATGTIRSIKLTATPAIGSAVHVAVAARDSNAPIPVTLPKCGSTTFKLTAKNSANLTGSMSKTIDTADFAPRVDQLVFDPTAPVVGKPLTITASGKNLQPGYTLALAGCTPVETTSPSTTQRSYSCTPQQNGRFTARLANGSTRLLIQSIVIKPAPVTCTPPQVPNAAGTACVIPIIPQIDKFTLPHTGITGEQCYKAGSDTLVSCTGSEAIALSGAGKQDGMRTHINPMSYSLVPKAGGGFYAKTECVKDNVTGLIWEGKTNDGGLRDYRKNYTNYDDATQPQKPSGAKPTQAEIDAASNSVGYVKAVNATGLCGYTDWRLPTVDELQSIVNYGVVGRHATAVDANWFLGTRTIHYWTSLPVGDPKIAWYIYFGSGFVGSNYERGGGFVSVRLVRASQ